MLNDVILGDYAFLNAHYEEFLNQSLLTNTILTNVFVNKISKFNSIKTLFQTPHMVHTIQNT